MDTGTSLVDRLYRVYIQQMLIEEWICQRYCNVSAYIENPTPFRPHPRPGPATLCGAYRYTYVTGYKMV